MPEQKTKRHTAIGTAECKTCSLLFTPEGRDWFYTVTEAFASATVPVCPSCQRLFIVSGLMAALATEERRNNIHEAH